MLHKTAPTKTKAFVVFRLLRRLKGVFRRNVRIAVKRIETLLIRFASRGPRRSVLYYALRGSRFAREQQHVLAGRRRFQADTDNPRKSSALLRRAVHRLEKGLISRPRRAVFALPYIAETLVCYERAIAGMDHPGAIDRDELKWAYDVLSDYFTVVGSHPKIEPLSDRFRALSPPTKDAGDRYVPFFRDIASPPPVNCEQLLRLARRRRSVRWFLQKPVPRAVISKAIEVASLSPSACNRQPFVFRVFDDPNLVPEVAALPTGTAGFCHNFPVIVVLLGQLRNYFDERDRHLIYIDGSLAAMSFIYALEAQGLSSCCINWPDIEECEREMEGVLKLEEDERPVMLIALGYPDPDGLVPYSQKKPPEILARFNFE